MPDKVKKIMIKKPVEKSGYTETVVSNNVDPMIKNKPSEGASEKPKIFKRRLVATSSKNSPNLVRDDLQGINIDKTTAHATPDAFERKIVKYGSGSSAKTKIIGADGKQIYEGRDSDKATREALAESASKTKDVMKRREKNAEAFHWSKTGGQELSVAEMNKKNKKTN